MAKTVAVSQKQNVGMMFVITYFVMFIVNSLVLYLAQMFFPQSIVLGTHALSYWWAIGMSMGKLALLDTLVMPFVSVYEQKMKMTFSPMHWMGLYLVVNFVGLWVISRFSEQFGLGVTSWMVVLALALVLDMAQGVVMMAISPKPRK